MSRVRTAMEDAGLLGPDPDDDRDNDDSDLDSTPLEGTDVYYVPDRGGES